MKAFSKTATSYIVIPIRDTGEKPNVQCVTLFGPPSLGIIKSTRMSGLDWIEKAKFEDGVKSSVIFLSINRFRWKVYLMYLIYSNSEIQYFCRYFNNETRKNHAKPRFV